MCDAWKSWLPTATALLLAALRHARRPVRALEELARVLRARDPDLRRHARRREAHQDRRARLGQAQARRASSFKRAPSCASPRRRCTRVDAFVAATRQAAESAIEALRITEIAYRAGATTNIEVVQAQQTARNAEIEAAVAEDRLRQARLDLLVTLGQFP